MGDRVVNTLGHLVHRQVRDRAVQWRCADKRMNSRRFRVFHGFPAAVDVFVIGAGEATDRRGFCQLRDLGYGAEIAFGSDGETGFDNIDAHFIEQLGDFQLFFVGHCGAGGLLAVAQGCVENQHAVFGHGSVPCLSLALKIRRWFPLSGRAEWHAQRRLRSRLRPSRRRPLPAREMICACLVMGADYIGVFGREKRKLADLCKKISFATRGGRSRVAD